MISYKKLPTHKWRPNIASWGVSMKINNENTNILHIKFSWIHVMENNIKVMYQLIRRQET